MYLLLVLIKGADSTQRLMGQQPERVHFLSICASQPAESQDGLTHLGYDGAMLILGIETSCDETGLALYDTDKGLIDQVLYSQVDLHADYGGVVPELASRDHVRKIAPLTRQLMERTQYQLSDLDGIAYTAGPGLMGALLVGASYASTL